MRHSFPTVFFSELRSTSSWEFSRTGQILNGQWNFCGRATVIFSEFAWSKTTEGSGDWPMLAGFPRQELEVKLSVLIGGW
jgi:hypothetical protein